MGAGPGFVPGLHHAEAYYPNTTAAALRSPAWQRLLSRVGDGVMMHLLLHCYLFLPLPNGCFLQAAGAPAAQVPPTASRRVIPVLHLRLSLRGSLPAGLRPTTTAMSC